MNLFDLTQEAKAILAMEDVDQQAIDDTLEGLGLDDKFSSYSAIIKTLNADSDALAGAIKQLQDKKKSTENKVSRLKEMAMNSMMDLDMTKAGNAIHSLTLRAGSKMSKVSITVCSSISSIDKICFCCCVKSNKFISVTPQFLVNN